MNKKFNYRKFEDTSLNNLVDNLNNLTEKSINKLNNENEYESLNKNFNIEFIKKITELSNLIWVDLDTILKDNIYKNDLFKNNLILLLTQAISFGVPTVLKAKSTDIIEIEQIGFGDCARYLLTKENLSIFNEGYDEKILSYNNLNECVEFPEYNEYAIKTLKKSVFCTIDWKKVSESKFDWGKLIEQIAMLYANQYLNPYAQKVFNLILQNKDFDFINEKEIKHIYISDIVKKIKINNSCGLAIANFGKFNKYFVDAYWRKHTVVDNNDYLNRFGRDYFEYNIFQDPGFMTYGHSQLVETNITNLNNQYVYVIETIEKPFKIVIEGDSTDVKENTTQKNEILLTLDINMRIGMDIILGNNIEVFSAIR
jgi:hypothetical protein